MWYSAPVFTTVRRARRLLALGVVAAVAACLLAPPIASATYLQSYSFVQKWPFPVPLPSASFSPHGMAIASGGNLLVAGHDNYLARYTTAGSLVTTFGQSASTTDGPIGQCDNVAARGNTIWALDPNVGLMKFDGTGVFSGTSIYGFGSGDALNIPDAIAIDASGCVYVSDTGAPSGYSHRILKFTSNGTYVTSFGYTGSNNMNWLESASGLAIGPHFEVYAADWQSGLIRRYAPANSGRTSYKYVGTWSSSAYPNPRAVAVDIAGNVFVLNDYPSATITKIDPSGSALAHWGGNGTGNGKFTYAWDLAVNSSGHVFVDDRDAATVQEFKNAYVRPATFAKSNVSVTKGHYVTFTYKADADVSGRAVATIRVFKGATWKATISCGTVSQGYWHTKSWLCKLAAGSYTWKVYATDTSGHTQRNIAYRTLTVHAP